MDFKLKSQTVEFTDSDGQVIGSLTVTQPSLAQDQTRAEMELIAEQTNKAELDALGDGVTDAHIKRQSFRLNIYPKLAACSSGDVPDEETTFTMPAREMYKWYDAAYSVTPEWFRVFDEIAEAYKISKEAGKELEKKKELKQPE